MSLEQMLHNAKVKGDAAEVLRLSRLIERLDSQSRQYGKQQRGDA